MVLHARQGALRLLSLRLHVQALWQLAALGTTLVLAVVGGALAGLIVAKVNPAGHEMREEDLFEDAVFWYAVLEAPLASLPSLCANM